TLALLPTTDAFAAGTVSGASPSVVGNTVPSQQVSFITTTAFNAQVPPNVQLTDAAANTVRSTVTADGVTPDAGGGSKVTATFHFVSGFGSAPAAPGSYNIDICQVLDQNNDCTAVAHDSQANGFTVTGLDPIVTGLSTPVRAKNADTTPLFTIQGQNF